MKRLKIIIIILEIMICYGCTLAMWVGREACSYEKIKKNGDIEYSSTHGQGPYNKYRAQLSSVSTNTTLFYYIFFSFVNRENFNKTYNE